MSETKEIPTLYFTLQTKEGQAWHSGKSWQEIQSYLDQLRKELSDTKAALFSLQRICKPQLIGACKPDILKTIEQVAKGKRFKRWDIINQTERWYGWEASSEAFEELIKEGVITHKRGWNQLATLNPKETGDKRP